VCVCVCVYMYVCAYACVESEGMWEIRQYIIPRACMRMKECVLRGQEEGNTLGS